MKLTLMRNRAIALSLKIAERGQSPSLTGDHYRASLMRRKFFPEIQHGGQRLIPMLKLLIGV